MISKPSTSDKNVSQHTEWVYDGSGAVSLYVNQRSLDVLSDVSNTPKYIWLLESQQIISGVYEWIINNYDFVASRVDGIFSCDENLCQRYDKFKYCISNAAPWIEEREIYEKTNGLYDLLKQIYGSWSCQTTRICREVSRSC